MARWSARKLVALRFLNVVPTEDLMRAKVLLADPRPRPLALLGWSLTAAVGVGAMYFLGQAG